MAEIEIVDDRIASVCRALADHHVDFVVIGGVAARLHETGHATVDIDICPSRSESNLERLAAALRVLGSRLRVEGEPGGIAFDPHPQQLRQMSTLVRCLRARPTADSSTTWLASEFDAFVELGMAERGCVCSDASDPVCPGSVVQRQREGLFVERAQPRFAAPVGTLGRTNRVRRRHDQLVAGSKRSWRRGTHALLLAATLGPTCRVRAEQLTGCHHAGRTPLRGQERGWSVDGAGHRISIPGYSDFVEVGRGGFAVVYRAQQEVFQREVAVKMITVLDVDDDARRRFQRECTAIGGLAWHPHIVTVFDAGDTPAGSPYLVMEYLPAGSLGDRMRRDGSVPWPEVVAIGVKIGGALQAAHEAGTLHRDIKPDNVLINRVGEPTLADFGIVTLQDGTRSRSGVLTATVAYAPPEVIAGERATVASDVYSLGAMLHALLAGSAPFTRPTDESMFAVMRRIDNEPPADLRPLGVPDRVAGAIEQCMAKSPQDRPLSAAAVGELLTAHADVAKTGHPTAVAIVPPSAIAQVAVAPVAIDEPVRGNSHPASIDPSTPPAAALRVGHAASRVLGGRRVLFAAAVIAMVAGAVVSGLVAGDDAPDEDTAAGSAASDADFRDQFPDPEEGQALTVVGTGTSGDSGDGDAPVTLLDNPWTLFVDDSGLLKLVDTGRDRVRVVQDAFVTTVLGPPAEGDLAAPRGLSVGAGGIHIADTDRSAIVRFESDGVSTVIAGQVSSAGYSGDDGPATAAQLDNPHGLAEGPDGALFIADSNNNAIRRVGPDGIITTVAGVGSEGFSGDGGAAVDAEFDAPLAVAFDRQGRLLIADTDNNVIRRVALDGVVTTIAGTGEAGFAGDDGPADQALLHAPSALVVAEDGTLYVADSLNMRIRRIDVDGTITTVVGNGEQGFVDSGPALEIPLDQPRGIDLGPDGDLFIADTSNSRVVRVDSSAL